MNATVKMLLVPAYWVAFTNDQVPNLVVPYSHPQPKFISANIKFLMHLWGFLKTKVKVFMIRWMFLQKSLILYLLKNQLVKVRKC
jgi:hypothetical protein